MLQQILQISSYRNPIRETAYNTNGYLTFSKETGIDMEFTGSNEAVYLHL